MVVLLLCPAVTEALQQMDHFGRDFINSTVCLKKNKNKTPNPEPSLPLVLFFYPCVAAMGAWRFPTLEPVTPTRDGGRQCGQLFSSVPLHCI